MINEKDIKAAREQNDFDFGNEVLYKMCKKSPSHEDSGHIIGKVWLIGRSYAADIGRGREKGTINDDFYLGEVPKLFKEHYKDIDSDISRLQDFDINFENLEKTLTIHKKLTDATKKVNKNREQRSFSSKYLHFHAPNAFFILDSRVKGALNKEIEERKLRRECRTEIKKFRNLKCDTEYSEFSVKCLVLRESLNKEFGVNLTPRQLDNLLIGKANLSVRASIVP